MAGEASTSGADNVHVTYRQYRGEVDLGLVMRLIDNELSEPYSIFTYRYFLRSWPSLCFFAMDGDHVFGTVVCKLDQHRGVMRGYLAMLVVEKKYRKFGVGSELVKRAIGAMIEGGCEEVVLEAEVTNYGALNLYRNLGFIRDKRLHKYYLNGTDAYRLKLLLPMSEQRVQQLQDQLKQQQQQQLDQALEGDVVAAEPSAADRQLQLLAARAAALGISSARTVTQI